MIKIPVEIGDTILMGKFKNKPVVIKTIGTDEHGMPTINGKKVATFRIKKEEKLGENKLATKKQKLDEAKFDGNLISLYLYGMIGRFKRDGKDIKDVRDYLEHMKKIDPEKEGKDFWNAVYSLLKKLYKKELGENKMSKKKQKLDEGMVMISGLLPVGPKLSLSMRGNKKDNFKFKGLPGQFNEQGEKVLDEFGDPIKEEEKVVKEEQDAKYYRDLLGTVEEGLNELVRIGEDGEVFRSPKSAHKFLNQAYTLVNKVK